VGFTLLWRGDLAGTEDYLLDALAQAERMGNVPLQDRCLAYQQILCRLDGDEEEARSYAEEGLSIATVEENPAYIGVARADYAWLNYRAGRLDEAMRDGRAALDQWSALA
jgi:hypothetical protein